MNVELEANLEKTYQLIKRECPHVKVDSLDVVRQVEVYRQFWRPEEVNVILLAESHVYTDEYDFVRECNQSFLHTILPAYPTRFVRFVYCLGYGEDALLSRGKSTRKNGGTPQFWKIFSSCISENSEDLGFNRVLKTGTRSLVKRLHNKVEVLRQMKKKGIWLMDSSIVGLYGNGVKKDHSTYKKILDICWDNYVGDIIEEVQPKFIIVIGKGVERAIGSGLKLPYEAIALPQARLSSREQMKNFRRYSEICSAIVKGGMVSLR